VIFGPGGIGKTTLATMAPGPVAVFDLDESLGVLKSLLPEGVDVRPVAGVNTFDGIRGALHSPGWDEIQTIVIDSATRLEEEAMNWVIANVKHENGNPIARIEDYGFGKGYSHIYESFLGILADLDSHVRAGRNVILICHDCTANVPNPKGEDYIRYEPRLQAPPSGKASIRLRVREWADHVFFLGYDVDAKSGKGKGSGTRAIYPTELPFCMAKSRKLEVEIPYQKYDMTLWCELFDVEPPPAG